MQRSSRNQSHFRHGAPPAEPARHVASFMMRGLVLGTAAALAVACGGGGGGDGGTEPPTHQLTVEAWAGTNQTALDATAVAVPPTVRVIDETGAGVSGLSVSFAVVTGEGSVTGGSQTTDGGGVAAVSAWTLGRLTGSATGALNSLRATVSGSGITGNPVTFMASSWGNLWSVKAPGLLRAGLGAAAINGIIYTVGGHTTSAYLMESATAYNPATDQWTPIAALPTRRVHLGVGVIDGILYAVGGQDASDYASKTLEIYDPATNTWAGRTAMQTPRRGLGVGVINGILYAVGGYDTYTDQALATVEAYNPATNTWSARASMQTPRMHHAVAVLNGKLHALGGYDAGRQEPVTSVEVYDPATNSWSPAAPMPVKRAYHAAVVVNGLLYTMAGSPDTYGLLSTVDAYDPGSNSWSARNQMPWKCEQLALVQTNGVLYAIGGYAAGYWYGYTGAYQP